MSDLVTSLNNFPASLYETRWKEVVRFLKALLPLLPAVNLAWDTEKYIANVDNEGKARPVQQRVEKQREVEQGIVKFDPAQITITLRAGLFCRFCQLAIEIENAPEKIAIRLETCPCHRALCERLSPHYKAKFMESCYGNGFTSCPMAGRNADLLAAGYANDTFPEVWKTLEKHLHTSEFVVGARPISMDDWQILHGNASSSKAYLWAEFELKLVPYTHLPGVFSVLGHATEDIARSGAARIIDMIGQDPRLKAHDTVTRTFIRPGVRRDELFNFASDQRSSAPSSKRISRQNTHAYQWLQRRQNCSS